MSKKDRNASNQNKSMKIIRMNNNLHESVKEGPKTKS